MMSKSQTFVLETRSRFKAQFNLSLCDTETKQMPPSVPNNILLVCCEI